MLLLAEVAAVYVAVECASPCTLCNYRVRHVMMGTARVNKRSLRVTGPFLGASFFTRCLECGWDLCGDSLRPRSAYVLAPEDAAKVAEYRMRKWGVESEFGPLVEVRVA